MPKPKKTKKSSKIGCPKTPSRPPAVSPSKQPKGWFSKRQLEDAGVLPTKPKFGKDPRRPKVFGGDFSQPIIFPVKKYPTIGMKETKKILRTRANDLLSFTVKPAKISVNLPLHTCFGSGNDDEVMCKACQGEAVSPSFAQE